MSVKLMAQVWGLALPHAEQWILLALADHANDFGEGHPGIPYLSWKVGYSPRQVQRSLLELERAGLLVVTRSAGGRGHYSSYELTLDDALRKPPPPGKGDKAVVRSPANGDEPVATPAGNGDGVVVPNPTNDDAVVPFPLDNHQGDPSPTETISGKILPDVEALEVLQSVPRWAPKGSDGADLVQWWRNTYANLVPVQATIPPGDHAIRTARSDRLAVQISYGLRDWWGDGSGSSMRRRQPRATFQNWYRRALTEGGTDGEPTRHTQVARDGDPRSVSERWATAAGR